MESDAQSVGALLLEALSMLLSECRFLKFVSSVTLSSIPALNRERGLS